MPLLITSLSICAVALACIGWLYIRLAVAQNSAQADMPWWESFHPGRYHAMLRLLSTEDLRFLEDRGCPGSQVRQLRRERVRIFQNYLREMTSDFAQLQSIGRAMILAGSASPDLQDKLFQSKVRFTQNLWMVRFELATYQLGIGTVNVSGLLESWTSTAQLVPVMAAQAA